MSRVAILGLVGLSAFGAPCTDDEAAKRTKCNTSASCAWTYSWQSADGKKHDRTWCYESADAAQQAFDKRVKDAETVARYFKEPSEAPALLRVYCDACGNPTRLGAGKRPLERELGKWWGEAVGRIEEGIAEWLKHRLPGPVTSAGIWLYELNGLISDFKEEAEALHAEVAEWAESGMDEISKQLEQHADELRDDAARIDASRTVAPPGVVVLPPVFELPGHRIVPPVVRDTVGDAAGVKRDVRYSMRLGFDNRFHFVFSNKGNAPRSITFKSAHSEPTELTLPANGAAVAVVSHQQAVLLPVCNPLSWGAGCGVEIIASDCAPGEVRAAKGQCIPDCPTGLLGRRTPKGPKCECPPKKRWDPLAKSCIGESECPQGLVAKRTPAGVDCTCAKGTRFDAAARRCVEDTCLGGAAFDVATGRCTCPPSMQWSRPDAQCIEPACGGGAVFDGEVGRCVCPSNQVWITGSRACACPPGTSWDGSRCQLPPPPPPPPKATPPAEPVSAELVPFRDPTTGLIGYRRGGGGPIIIAAQFDNGLPFSEGLAAVAVRDAQGTSLGYGFIDESGNWIFRPQFFNCAFDGNCMFRNGKARVCPALLGNQCMWVNRSGQPVAGP